MSRDAKQISLGKALRFASRQSENQDAPLELPPAWDSPPDDSLQANDGVGDGV
jgi:hypothetical protein